MLVFNNIEEIEEYYNEETNTYVFTENRYIQEVKFNFDLDVNANIYASDIVARNIKALNIDGDNISALDIYANNIFACNIIADNIDYHIFCIANHSLKCKSIKGRRNKSIHRCLDKKIEYIKEEKLTEEQVIKQLEELIEDRESFIDTGDEDDEFFIKDRQALKQAIELLNQKNKVKSELEKFKNDIDTKLKKYKNAKIAIPVKQVQQKVNNLIKTFDK